MKKKVELDIPINRVEGDLDLNVTIEDGIVVDVKSKGTLYRGFENILKDKDPLDALVITPRVCGICSISHLLAAAKAIENAFSITPPPQAVRLRNLSIMAESIQSDLRQSFLMYLSDFSQKYYQDKSFYDDAVKLYVPFKGEMAKEVLEATSSILKIIATIGGQWPHTSHIVPGGVSTIPSEYDLLNIKNDIKSFKNWYESKILKTGIEEFSKLKSLKEYEAFLENHPSSQLHFFHKIAKQTDLFEIGKSGYGFISYGGVDDPTNPKEHLIPAGYYDNNRLYPFLQSKIQEDVAYSWFDSQDSLHPHNGETNPNHEKPNAYSWGKAPRYEGSAVQTGPLAEAIISKDPLFLDLYKHYEDSAYVRQLARIVRPMKYITLMEKMMEGIEQDLGEPLYIKPKNLKQGEGFGLTEAARGSLGHWVKIKGSKIQTYQIISPTTWNGSPKDAKGNYGPWEKAILGTKVKDLDNPIEIGHIIRSFDPCLVCTVHFIGKNKKTKLRVGG